MRRAPSSPVRSGPSRPGAAFAALFLASLAMAAGPAGEPRIEVLQPRPGIPVLDRMVVAFVPVDLDPGRIAEARIEVDGAEFARLDGEPFVATGPVEIRQEPHVVRIRLVLTDGRVVERTVRTAPLTIDEAIDVRLVDLAVGVDDQDGAPVTDLERDDFVIRDQGRRVEIARFSRETRGLDVILVLDASESMKGERIERAREAAAAVVRSLEERDRIGLVTFHEKVDLVEPPTTDRDRILDGIAGVRARGGTALYDALVAASRSLERNASARRRVVLVLSDGRDAARTGWKPASLASLEDAIRAAHRANVLIYAVGLGGNLAFERSIDGRLTTADVLKKLARTTGGRFRILAQPDRLETTWERLLTEARLLYSLAFRPPPARHDGEWHRIEVDVDRPRVRVRTREGYFARAAGAGTGSSPR